MRQPLSVFSCVVKVKFAQLLVIHNTLFGGLLLSLESLAALPIGTCYFFMGKFYLFFNRKFQLYHQGLISGKSRGGARGPGSPPLILGEKRRNARRKKSWLGK